MFSMVYNYDLENIEIIINNTDGLIPNVRALGHLRQKGSTSHYQD